MVALPHQEHKDLSEVLGTDPVFTGMDSKAVNIQDSLFTVLSHSIMAKGMDMASTAQAVSIVRTACTMSEATPVDSEPVTAWEASVPLVFLDMALNKLRRREAEGHQVLAAEPPRAQVAPGPALRLRGPKF